MRILENDDTLPSFARDAVHRVLGYVHYPLAILDLAH
jgi:hypothetical protein